MVNGVELTVQNSLSLLRTACSFYGISTSGSKQKCFARLMNHQAKMQLETVKDLAKEVIESAQRIPNEVILAKPPDPEVHTFPMLHGAHIVLLIVRNLIVMIETLSLEEAKFQW